MADLKDAPTVVWWVLQSVACSAAWKAVLSDYHSVGHWDVMRAVKWAFGSVA